ncbi:MAG: hypothetical protein AUG51_08895 [Acidobacteria bacterium 13_1_20CM_3_53_8]|nr:MAG: hypothetical protein AUG51_08895 [Acidobacteria bacterium 13_1_20CM_3_53_8]
MLALLAIQVFLSDGQKVWGEPFQRMGESMLLTKILARHLFSEIFYADSLTLRPARQALFHTKSQYRLR